MTKVLFVGEKPSVTAEANGWRWEDGRLAASTLFDAIRQIGIDPLACRFVNLFGDYASDTEKAKQHRLREIKAAAKDGWRIVALGEKVSRQLSFPHTKVRHPAARGACRAKDVYRAHVAAQMAVQS